MLQFFRTSFYHERVENAREDKTWFDTTDGLKKIKWKLEQGLFESLKLATFRASVD